MKRTAVYHVAPRAVDVVEEALSSPAFMRALVTSRSSAISAGTELLFYRGQVAEGTPLDANLPSLGGSVEYPFKYGYANVGRVAELGDGVEGNWKGVRVFSFHAHESAFVAPTDELIRLPDWLSDDDAVFYASMETAASIAMDANPLLGEDVVVLGQGIIGLLVTAVLAKHPLGSLTTVDISPSRRILSMELGAGRSLSPGKGADSVLEEAGLGPGRADLVVELSGNPDALNLALKLVGHEGRIVIGSWYGTKAMQLDLGTEFHRKRVRLIGSQVSTIGPSLTGRWDRRRRYDLVAKMLRRVGPSRLITHRFPVTEAARAFALLDTSTEGVGQVVLDYPGGDG